MTVASSGAGLLERSAELERIAALVERALDSSGGVVLVEAPAGLGKTRLAQAAIAGGRAAELTVLSACGSELERDVPFGVVQQLFEPYLAGASTNELNGLLSGAARLAAGALSVEREATLEVAGERLARDPSAVLHGLYWLCVNLAEDRPLLIVADDVQWADLASVRFLAYLARRLESLAVGLFLTVRSGEPGSEIVSAIALDQVTHVLELEPLSQAAVLELIRSNIGGQAPEGLAGACHEVTAGNPFLVQEVLRMLAARGSKWALSPDEELRELRTMRLERSILRRLQAIHPQALAVARAVAVLVPDAAPHRVAALVGVPESIAAEVIDDLIAADLIEPGHPVRFIHPIVSASVYANIPHSQRSALHRRAAQLAIADGLGDERAAPHLLRSDPAADPEAVATLRSAAGSALRTGASETAADLLARALAEPPTRESLGGVLRELGLAEIRAGRSTGVLRLTEAIPLTLDPEERASAATALAGALTADGRAVAALEVIDEAITYVSDLDRELQLVLEAQRALTARLDLATHDESRARVQTLARRLGGDTPGERRVIAVAATTDQTAGMSAAATAELCERALASESSERADDDVELSLLPVMLMTADRLTLARDVIERMLAKARARGSASGFVQAITMCSFCSYSEGDLGEAEADARAALECGMLEGWLLAPSVAGLIQVLILRGELEEAEQLLHASALDGRLPEIMSYNVLLHVRGQLRMTLGQDADGLADLLELGDRHGRWGIVRPAPPWRADAARALERAGRHAEALALAKQNDEVARRWGTPRTIGVAIRTLAFVRGGEELAERLTEAATVLSDSPARLDHAETLLELGAVLRRQNRRRDAREPLRRALDIAERCGATGLAARARDELRATGARPRRGLLTGVESLTASELRVARMAAGGQTNRDIAQNLFVTVNTVETHLRHVFQKLDVRSRTDLVERL